MSPTATRSNRVIADEFDRVADLLEAQRANQFRVQAWRGGAHTVRHLSEPIADLCARDGVDGLEALPGIGRGLARAIRQRLETGRLATLDQLIGRHDPLAMLTTVPGLGHRLAERLHNELGITTLDELQHAADDGRLSALPGFGEKRLAGIRSSLAARRRRAPHGTPDEPPVTELLDIDREYRHDTERGALPRIAPKRMNPRGERWLPVLHVVRGHRHFTALYSNTPRAHQLGRTRDWVVICEDGRDGDRQWTVVTENEGALRGQRVVRGREVECEAALRGQSQNRFRRPTDGYTVRGDAPGARD